ncbi:uncharacterized protein LOC127427151 [Myxocyprinus asiaticus]|uniref:uncharacterized protein LOC127427151 n=1 Tax=Myxocyprinus asiaticus TaxID=70543 RepID=UPI0022235D9F|nr:uncharacterized protein LOC127427151 [Myxocyprinus asiaticus]
MKVIHIWDGMEDHSYALPASPTGLKARLREDLVRVESLEREMRNVTDRERRAKNTVQDLLEDLKGKNVINEEAKERLNFYSGGWKNNHSAGQFQSIFCHLMVRCGVYPSTSGNVAAQDETVSLSAVEMSSALAAEETEELPSPFVNISAIVCGHSYLPTHFGSLVDNALVYILGFVVRQILRKLSCDVCHASLVTCCTHII